MSRRDRSTATDSEICAALRELAIRLTRIPEATDINADKTFPLNATGILRRFGSLERALLLASVIWFPQPHTPVHEPLGVDEMIVISSVKEMFESDDSQILFLGAIANPEDLLRENISAGRPVGGLAAFSRDHNPHLHPIFMNVLASRMLDVTSSARAYEVFGVLALPDGEPYVSDGQQTPAAMIITYDRHEPYGLYFDGRFAIPRQSLDGYLRAQPAHTFI